MWCDDFACHDSLSNRNTTHSAIIVYCRRSRYCCTIQGGPKIWHTFCRPYNLIKYWPIFKLSHCQKLEKICNNTITTDPTARQMCRYTTLWNVGVLKSTTENKTSVTTHFNKLTAGNNVLSQLLFIVTVTSCSFFIKCSIYIYISALLLDDALLKGVVTEVVLFWFWQWQIIENWSILDEVIRRTQKCANFFGPPCIFKLSAQRNETETKQFQNRFKSVSKLFWNCIVSVFISVLARWIDLTWSAYDNI